MSRAALWRQEGNVKERERRAQQIFEDACAAGRHNRRNGMVTWGSGGGGGSCGENKSNNNNSNNNNNNENDSSSSNFHWNPLLLHNTIHSTYFQKCCTDLHDWNATVDEIYYQVQSLEPFSTADKQPSTAFCLLLRLLTLRLTEHQVELTIQHADSPYIRGLGFLYLRYVGMPDRIWTWIEPYLYDEQELTVEAAPRGTTTTMGEFVRRLFGSSREFYGTPLPRYPIREERELQVRLLQADHVAQRAARHWKNQDTIRYFATLGNQVMALYSDDENPVITWYQAVVDRVISLHPETGLPLKYPRYVVTFTEYGNTETVLLGEMDLLDGTWSKEDPNTTSQPAMDHTARGSSNGGATGGGRDLLYEQVRQRERETATADRNWSRRPPTTKRALTSMPSRHGGAAAGSSRFRNEGGPPPPTRHQEQDRRQDHRSEFPAGRRQPEPEARKKRSADEMRAIQEKKQKLLAKYG